MAKCIKCNLEILDETEFCPLCHSVLEPTDALDDMYPDIRPKQHMRLIFSRIYLLCAIMAETALVIINILTDSVTYWSIITGLGMLYGYMVLRYAIIGKVGYRSKTIVLSIIGIISIITIDFVIGYRGWSIDFVLPAGLLLMDAAIGICMIINRRNWQSYIMWQLGMVFISLIPILLNLIELEKHKLIAFAPFAASLIMFISSMTLGGSRAASEIERRFHVN